MSRYRSLSSHPRELVARYRSCASIWLCKITFISCYLPIRLVWLNSITLPMRYKPTSQPSPVPMPAKSAFSYPRNCEPTREKLATKKDKNSLSSPPPKVIFPSSLPPSHACDDKKKDKERARPTQEGRKEGRSEWSQDRKDDHTNHIS